MKLRILFATVTLVLSTGLDALAQDGRHSFSFSIVNGSDNLSYHVINRSDSDYEEYIEDDVNGYGFGYAFKIAAFVSAEIKYESVKYRGYETVRDNWIDIDDEYYMFGLKLHPLRRIFKVELNFDYLISKSSLNYETQFLNGDLQGEGTGGEVGLAVGFQFLKINSIMFETNARLVLNNYDDEESSSFDVNGFWGYNAIAKFTYEIEF